MSHTHLTGETGVSYAGLVLGFLPTFSDLPPWTAARRVRQQPE
jgi:hypothetical protein